MTTEVMQRRSNNKNRKPDVTTATNDDVVVSTLLNGTNNNNNGSSNSNSNNGISHPHKNNNNIKRKARTSSSLFTINTVAKYIITLILILFGITLLHQWEHPESTTHIYNSDKNNKDSNQIDTAMIRQTIIQNNHQRNKNSDLNSSTNNRTIAYVITITSCNGHERDNTFQIVEGASVLRHSIHMNSIRQQQQQQQDDSGSNTATDGTKQQQRPKSVFDYHLYAFYHPDAEACAIPLLEFGYIIEARPTPVPVTDIQNPLLRERIVQNGCCGEKELIKFEAFTLTSYPLVVLLDIDTLILQPLDRLFHFMLSDTSTTSTQQLLPDEDDFLYYPHRPALTGRNTNVTLPTFPHTIDLLYTTDYAMVNANRYIKPVQGGFVILRPNQTVYNDFVDIVQVGDFQFDGDTDLGWGGRTGRFWGGTYKWLLLLLLSVSR